MSEQHEMGWRAATDLAGKTVVVTGCASGIGRATAIQFANAGAIVYGGDVNETGGKEAIAEITAAGGKAEFMPLDLANRQSIDNFVDLVKQKTGNAVDIIASVAGWERVGPFLENTPDFWDKVIAINYLGPVRMIHRFLPAMIERGQGGKIVTVASDAGRVGSLGESFYSGSKGAIIAFTKSLAREMARNGINCNCVAPGLTDTPLFHDGIQNPKLKEALLKAVPLRRLAKPIEPANTIVYLATPAADFITGQVISVSGGLTMHG
ncbi:MAG: SDR family oxidoreductase [Azonexus sp.]|jgi:2-hydroxycyclohexanecarboxyl-CoA dehydrogenase|nr:SDR family oxidoreductase [Azonexus sp.]